MFLQVAPTDSTGCMYGPSRRAVVQRELRLHHAEFCDVLISCDPATLLGRICPAARMSLTVVRHLAARLEALRRLFEPCLCLVLPKTSDEYLKYAQ